MSRKEAYGLFRFSWDPAYEVVKYAVSWELTHRDPERIEAIRADEDWFHKGHHYPTVVYQLDRHQKRLLWVGPERTAKTLPRFFRFLGKKRTAGLQFIWSDIWQGYIKVIRKKAGHTFRVLNRFHVMQLAGCCSNVRRISRKSKQ